MSDQSIDLRREIPRVVAGATDSAVRVGRVWIDDGTLCLAIAPLSVVLEVAMASAGGRAYRNEGAYAFAYRAPGGSLSRDQMKHLDRAIVAVAPVLAAVEFDPRRDALASDLAGMPDFPTPYHRDHLRREMALPIETVEAYRRDGHVLVRRAIHPDVVRAAAPHLSGALERWWPEGLAPARERADAYARSFTQITDIGQKEPRVAVFSQARRVLAMAAQLMGVDAVRVFCEDWLIKEPGASITPWHQDAAVFPFDAEATITCWIPLAAVGEGEGLLRFARGAQRIGLADIENINDQSEREFTDIIRDHGFPVDDLPPVFPGDVSFHDGRTIHGAYENVGDTPRVALAIHCFADGATIKTPTTPKMREILDHAAPGAAPGDPAVSERWPRVYGKDGQDGNDPSPPEMPAIEVEGDAGDAFELEATNLEDGAPVHLFVSSGQIHRRPIVGARPLAPRGGFVTSGLVQSHGHVSYPHTREDAAGTEAWMNERRAEYAAIGVLTIRDMGAVDDAICRLVDVPGLPRVHGCGTMILRNADWPFTCTEPDGLVRACAARVEAGARWVKVFADFTDDYRGRENSGFTGTDEVSYPREVLAEAVRIVHGLGARVAAHAFTQAGAEVALAAGVDSIEHGWGLTEELVDRMADEGVAWAPLVGIATPMWRVAHRDRQPERAAWIEQVMERLARLLPRAEGRQVTVLAGTDLFPEVTVADEVAQLIELGLSPAAAVGAASWVARTYLGEPGLEDGAPADLVVFAEDPRRDPTVLLTPTHIFSAGQEVVPLVGHVRPSYRTFRQRQDH